MCTGASAAARAGAAQSAARARPKAAMPLKRHRAGPYPDHGRSRRNRSRQRAALSCPPIVVREALSMSAKPTSLTSLKHGADEPLVLLEDVHLTLGSAAGEVNILRGVD